MERNGADGSSTGSRWSWPGTLVCAVAIALAGVAVYWNSLDGQFVFDDQGWIVDNPSIRHLWPPSEWLFPADAAHVGGRPVVSLTLALNYAIGGLDVRGYHAVNLAIHILTALVLFGVARRTLLLSRPFVGSVAGTHSVSYGALRTPISDLRLPTLLALAIALIWVVHPLNTEAVSYVIQRAESLVSLFYLLTLYAVIRGATAWDGSPEPSSQRSSPRWYFAAVMFCFLGMATKEVMVTAPILILLYDAIFLAGSFRRALAARWRLYLAMAASWGVLAWTLAATRFHAESTGLSVAGFTPLSYLCTEPGVILGYLKLAVWPNSLCFAYGLPPASWPQEIILPGMTIVAILALVIWALIKRPALGFLGAAFFLILAPTSSFVPILDAAFEHRMYLALAPLVALAVVTCFSLWRQHVVRSRSESSRTRWALWTLAPALAGIVVGLAAVTIARNRDYATELTIWGDTVIKRPGSWRAHYNLGHALSNEHRGAEAIEQYRQTLALDPDYPQAIHNLAAELALQGKIDEAMPLFEREIAIEPHNAEAHFNLAVALATKGQIELAIHQYQAALAIRPDNAETHKNLGMLFWRQGDPLAAASEFRAAIRLQPDFVKPRAALAGLLAQQGRLDEAGTEARRTLEIAPHAADAHAAMGDVLAAKGMADAAVAEYLRAIEIEPEAAETQFHLATALESQGKTADAIAHLLEATRLQPHRPEYLSRLAWILATTPEESLRDGVSALALAKRAMQLTGGRDPLVLAARAAAEAELGRFPEAVQFAEQAIAVTQKLPNQEPFLAATREQIKLYESGQPYHMPARR